MKKDNENDTNPFFAFYEGDTYQDAFKKCRTSLIRYETFEQYKYSNVKYKDTFTEIPLEEWCEDDKPSKAKAVSYSKKLLFNSDCRIADKWKQIGVIEYSDGKFLFFGWLVKGERRSRGFLEFVKHWC